MSVSPFTEMTTRRLREEPTVVGKDSPVGDDPFSVRSIMRSTSKPVEASHENSLNVGILVEVAEDEDSTNSITENWGLVELEAKSIAGDLKSESRVEDAILTDWDELKREALCLASGLKMDRKGAFAKGSGKKMLEIERAKKMSPLRSLLLSVGKNSPASNCSPILPDNESMASRIAPPDNLLPLSSPDCSPAKPLKLQQELDKDMMEGKENRFPCRSGKEVQQIGVSASLPTVMVRTPPGKPMNELGRGASARAKTTKSAKPMPTLILRSKTNAVVAATSTSRATVGAAPQQNMPTSSYATKSLRGTNSNSSSSVSSGHLSAQLKSNLASASKQSSCTGNNRKGPLKATGVGVSTPSRLPTVCRKPNNNSVVSGTPQRQSLLATPASYKLPSTSSSVQTTPYLRHHTPVSGPSKTYLRHVSQTSLLKPPTPSHRLTTTKTANESRNTSLQFSSTPSVKSLATRRRVSGLPSPIIKRQ